MKTIAKREHVKIWPHSELYTVSAKNAISPKVFNRFSKTLPSAQKILRVGIWVESFSYTGILLLQWQGENLRIDNIWNFATFNAETVPVKILYLQMYWTDFRNLGLRSKMLTVGIWIESFSYTGILVLPLQGENLRIDNIWNFATFNVDTVPAKMLYHQRYSTDFQKLCLLLERRGK